MFSLPLASVEYVLASTVSQRGRVQLVGLEEPHRHAEEVCVIAPLNKQSKRSRHGERKE